MMAIAGCALDKQGAPSLTGPSELALSLTTTATPDVITQDGTSQSTIQIVARGPNGQPWTEPLQLRAEVRVGIAYPSPEGAAGADPSPATR